MSSLLRRSATALATASATLLAACGGGGDDGGPKASLSREEASTVAGALFSEVFTAVDFSDAFAAKAPAAGGALTAARRAAASRAAASRAAAGQANLSLNATCERGGRITGAYQFTDNTNDAGTGTVSGSMTITPQGCVVSTGSRDLAVNGSPSLQYTFSMALTEGEPSGNMVWRATGGFVWAGGSCSQDYTITMTPDGRGSISGTLCGQSVSQSL